MMTDDEYDKYGKRIYGIQEKGFKIRVSRIGGGAYRGPSPKPARRRSSTRTPTPRRVMSRPQTPIQRGIPLFKLDERDKFSKTMIEMILKSDYAKDQGGLFIGDIKTVLDHYHIKYGTYQQLNDFVRNLYKTRKLSGRREGPKRRYFVKEVEE